MAGSGVPAPLTPVSAFDRVREQLSRLVERFGLKESEAALLQAFDAICARSLSFPVGSRLPLYSRLNDDGTPIQLATAAGVDERPLQLLGEAGWPGAGGKERLRAARACLCRLARILSTVDASDENAGEGLAPSGLPDPTTPPGEASGDLRCALKKHVELLDTLAPEDDPDLLSDPAGALWLGAGFARSHPPQLTVYANGSWGQPDERWFRLRGVARHFRAQDAWLKVEKLMESEMEPLGSAVTFAGDGSVSGRIYLSAYGKLMSFYEEGARTFAGPDFAEFLRGYADQLLGNDSAYPTPNVICSLGLAAGRAIDFKIELCAHCLCGSDVEARDRLHRAFTAVGADSQPYDELLGVVSGGELSTDTVEIHTYAGIGSRGSEVYCPVYLKPRLTA